MSSRNIASSFVVIVLLATAFALLAADPPEWRRARSRLSVLTSPTEVARLVSPLPVAGDELGRSVAARPGVIVVGAPGDVIGDPSLYVEGVAHVFVGGGGRWRHRQRLLAFDRERGDGFGRSVAIDGNTIAIGAEHDDHGDVTNAGSVYVFVRTGRAWTLEAKLTAPDPRTEAHFGHSLALDGDTLAVGTWATDAVYVFERTGAWWPNPQVVRATPEQVGNFGQSLALDGDRMVVGAQWRFSAGLTDAGGASVFERLNQEWVLDQDLAASDPGSDDFFGGSVDIAGDLVVVGAPQDDDEVNESSGSAYVFSRVDGEWAELQKLVPFDASPWQRFGWSVAVASANLLVGSPSDSPEGIAQAGSVCLFRLSEGSWLPSSLLTADGAAPYDVLGETAISGHTAVLGARLADVDGRTDAGAAHVFLLP